MANIPYAFSLNLPIWVKEFSDRYQKTNDNESRMEFVIAAARENIQQQTGGPFAAAVFNDDSGELIALGVNIVTRENLAFAHAEMLALTLAQRRFDNFSLKNETPSFQLVTSSEPCAMCLGAICWSGIDCLVCGASSYDAREIGFDEGPISDDWQWELQQRGIKVLTGVLKKQAKRVLIDYRANNGKIYNGQS